MTESNETFVTIFDYNFLPQGIALHRSLIRYLNNFELWICCLDDEVYDFLEIANLSCVKIFRVSELENFELLKVKKNRTIGEYAWTLTPFLPSYVFKVNSALTRVTYLDADIWFLKSPRIILDIFSRSEKSLLLTPHDFLTRNDLSSTVGKYCVQFLTVTRSAQPFLIWWQKLCVDWCYARFDQNRFGDQKYLDLVPSKFPKLYLELSETYLTQGPWNVDKFDPLEAVLFHFHGLRINRNLLHVPNGKSIKRSAYQTFYEPYIHQMREIFQLYNFSVEFIQLPNLPILKQVKNFRQLAAYLYTKYILHSQKILKL